MTDGRGDRGPRRRLALCVRGGSDRLSGRVLAASDLVGRGGRGPRRQRVIAEASGALAGDRGGHVRVNEWGEAAAARAAGRRVAIMGDLSGPKMRIGMLAEEPVELKPGDPFILTTNQITGDATGQIYQLDATFKLVDSASGRVVLQGKGIARAPYNRFQEIFANIRARYDAENRAARSVAESIRTQIAAFLANAA